MRVLAHSGILQGNFRRDGASSGVNSERVLKPMPSKPQPDRETAFPHVKRPSAQCLKWAAVGALVGAVYKSRELLAADAALAPNIVTLIEAALGGAIWGLAFAFVRNLWINRIRREQ